MKRTKKKTAYWLIGIAGTFLALLALLAFLAVRQIESEQTQEKIRAFVAEQLGDTVQFQRATLSLFLLPHLDFHQVTLSVPGATFGSAETVSIYPRLLPLLLGKFRIAKFRAVSPDVILMLSETPEQPVPVEEQVSYPQVKKDLGSVLSAMRSVSPDLIIEVKNGTLALRKGQKTPFVSRNIRGRIALTRDGFGLRISGNADRFGPIAVQGDFSMEQDRMRASDIQATVLDSTLTSAVELRGSPKGLRMADISLDGTIGSKTVQWASKTFRLPPEQTVRAPLLLSNTRFTWKAESDIALAGSISIKNGPSIAFQAHHTPEEFSLSRFVLQDDESTASLSFRHTKRVLDFTFQGNLNERTLDRMFEGSFARRGWVRGELRAHLLLGKPAQSSAQGRIEGADFFLPLSMKVPIKIDRLELSAQRKTVSIKTGAFTWGETHFNLTGGLQVAADGLHVDMDLAADGLKVEDLLRAYASDDKKDELNSGEPKPEYPPVQGTIRLNSNYLSYGRFQATPLRADIALDEQGFHMTIIESSICGISLPGELMKVHEEFNLDFKPASLKQPLEPALACLWGENNVRISGLFDLEADLHARGKAEDLLRTIRGTVTFIAKDGEIHQYPLLARILSAVNVTDMVRGRFTNLGKKSLAYTSITMKGDIQDGKLIFQHAALEGPAVNLSAQGDINIGENTINVTVLVAPFKTVDTLVSSIPLVGTVLDNTLITIPVKVTGELDNPTVTPLSPTAFGEGAVGIIKRTLQLPYKLIQPFIPEKKEP